MKKQASACLGVLLLSLIIASSYVSVATPLVLPTSAKKRFHLNDKVKHLAPLGERGPDSKGAPLKIDIIFPEDGSTLSLGVHTVLVSAYARAGISSVELKINGYESTGWIEITDSFDGAYYTHGWTVEADGTYYVTTRVTDSRGKSKQDTSTVYIGSKPPQKWAVVIGIADYQGRDSDLWHPDEDAKDMETELLEQGYPEANIKVLLNRKAKAQAIVEAIDWLIANEEAGDEVVFFYSGHGYRASDIEEWDDDSETDGHDEMIVTHDFYGLPDGWFRQKFSAIESTDFAIMFGSCHSGGMFDDDDDLQGTGRVIAVACEADQYGWDYLQLGNTLWGYWFVDQGLLANNADSVELAHEYAHPHVIVEQPDSQPQLYDNYSGYFGL